LYLHAHIKIAQIGIAKLYYVHKETLKSVKMCTKYIIRNCVIVQK